MFCELVLASSYLAYRMREAQSLVPFACVRLHADRAYVCEISPAELLPWTIRIAKRYMGTEQADAYGRRNAVDGELLIRVPLTKVTARKGIAQW